MHVFAYSLLTLFGKTFVLHQALHPFEHLFGPVESDNTMLAVPFWV
jgi:hypothetical protein